jgi:hypothetical protein
MMCVCYFEFHRILPGDGLYLYRTMTYPSSSGLRTHAVNFHERTRHKGVDMISTIVRVIYL